MTEKSAKNANVSARESFRTFFRTGLVS